jgi:glyceraldehyde-3-phosphate dehydrogenase (NAD(P))
VIRVGVVGYGTIGRRVADAVDGQPDMRLVGAAKRSPDYAARAAERGDVPLFAAGADSAERFDAAGIAAAGTTSDLVERADVVVDATPAGTGTTNRELYAARDTPAVFQGGEPARVAETSFTACVNYDDAVGGDATRVLSCNTTALARLLAPLEEAYGVERVRATLVRRGGDPGQSDRGPINDILPDPTGESHHAEDLRTVLPHLDVRTRGVRVPATLMHLQSVRVTLRDPPPDAQSVRDRLTEESRLMVVESGAGVRGCGDAMDLARELGRPRGDLFENCVFGASLDLSGAECSLFQAVHQESDVVPENVDAVRALAGTADAAESRDLTDRTLGIGADQTPAASASERPVAGEAGDAGD